MARGKRICGPRRVPLLAPGGQYGAIADDAIDLEETDFTKYIENLFDLDHLKFKPGEKPSWFTIHPMSTVQIRNAPEGSAIEIASWRVLCGLAKIENMVNISDDGTETAVAQPDRKTRGTLGEMATEKWLNESGLTTEDILGLGWMIGYISEPQLPFYSPSVKPSGPSKKNET